MFSFFSELLSFLKVAFCFVFGSFVSFYFLLIVFLENHYAFTFLTKALLSVLKLVVFDFLLAGPVFHVFLLKWMFVGTALSLPEGERVFKDKACKRITQKCLGVRKAFPKNGWSAKAKRDKALQENGLSGKTSLKIHSQT